MKRWRTSNPRLLGVMAVAALWLAGCKGIPTPNERAARQDLRAIAEMYRPQSQRPVLPELQTNSSLGDFLRFAILNQPSVEAAYFDWAASVERITRERSLPDPRLTFQMDIQEAVLSLMPGLMAELPWPGKLRSQGESASVESRAKYFAFENAVLQAAFAFKKSNYQIHFLTEKIRISRETLELAQDLEQIARKQNEVGKVTLQDVLRAQIEQDQLKTEITNLEDSRQPLLSQLKAALGLQPGEPNPPVPVNFETTPLDVTSDQLLATAFARNPRLKAMEADVRRATMALQLAYKARLPDFSGGLEADAKTDPTMLRPSLGISLPIWRDKIAAIIAEAQAGQRAAEARFSAEQITLAAELAEKSFLYREASRNLKLYQDALLPKARLSLDVARSGYLAGQIDFFNLIDAWRTLLNFELAEVEARTQRELLLAEVSLIIAGLPPAQAPFLTSTAAVAPLAQQAPNKSATPGKAGGLK